MIRHSLPTLGEEAAAAAVAVIRSGDIAQGVEIEAFERETAEFTGRKYGIAVSSGTAGHVFFRYVVSTPERAALEEHLKLDGIEAKRPVYKAVHLYFEGGGGEADVARDDGYPNADRARDCYIHRFRDRGAVAELSGQSDEGGHAGGFYLPDGWGD